MRDDVEQEISEKKEHRIASEFDSQTRASIVKLLLNTSRFLYPANCSKSGTIKIVENTEKSACLDRRVVDEDLVTAVVWLDEPKSTGSVCCFGFKDECTQQASVITFK